MNRFCSKCGKMNQGNGIYCSGCGAPLMQQNVYYSKYKNKKLPTWTIVLICIFGFFFLAALFGDSDTEKKANTDVNISNQNEDNNKKEDNNNLNDQNENDKKDKIEKVIFFSKMFEKYVGDDKKKNDLEKTKNLKDIIYKTYAKSIKKSNELKNEEKEEMKRIMDYLIYLQMKKVEMKLKFFSDFDRLIEFHKNKFKSTQSQLIQDRFKLTEQKAEMSCVVNQVKDVTKGNNEINNITTDKIEIEHDIKLLHL